MEKQDAHYWILCLQEEFSKQCKIPLFFTARFNVVTCQVRDRKCISTYRVSKTTGSLRESHWWSAEHAVIGREWGRGR